MISIDGDIVIEEQADGMRREWPIGSPEAFQILSRLWLRSGWDAKYVYTFTWLGRPIIQLPEDLLRIQEVVYTVRPDVIIETGVAHGGSLIFFATLCKAMDRGRVVGVEVALRPENRKAIEEHFLSGFITLIDGSSIAPQTVDAVRQRIRPGDRVLIVLDSRHTKDHVLAELRAYAPLVSEDSYIVAADGIMRDLSGAPRSADDWAWNNPFEAAKAFVAENANFVIEEPKRLFDESNGVPSGPTYWPGAWLKRRPVSGGVQSRHAA